MAHVYQSSKSWKTERIAFSLLKIIIDNDQKIKEKLGRNGLLFNLDAKIGSISRCDVDLRFNLLSLLVSLTSNCPENTLLVIRMKHWHFFIHETLEGKKIKVHGLIFIKITRNFAKVYVVIYLLEYPEIELQKLSIHFLKNLVTSENPNAARTFIMICLSFTEIIHSLLSSMRRWIRLAHQKPFRKKSNGFV